MPECHKCKWDKKPPSDEKQAACLHCVQICDLRNLTNKGKTFVSFDAARTAQSAAEIAASTEMFLKERNGADDVLIDPSDPATMAAMKLGAIRMLQFINSIDADRRDVLLMAIYSTLAEYARTIKKTRACTSKWWRDIVETHPELERVVFSNLTNPKIHAHGRVRKGQ